LADRIGLGTVADVRGWEYDVGHVNAPPIVPISIRRRAREWMRLLEMASFVRTPTLGLMQKTIGVLGAYYLRLVWKTSRLIIEPADIYQRAVRDFPIIIALWHGQHFMAPFLKRKGYRAKVLISRHRDGEVNAIAAERLGIGTVRGSGSQGGEFQRKGGVSAFHEMLEALADGYIMALTADVPKIARVAGLGIIKLAQASGRPIYPVAMATSRRYELSNWDRSVINLPFGRCALVVGEPIRVAADADAAASEAARRALEQALNGVTDRAYAIVDRRGEDGERG
jgi:lysophospholipid acyltransferase (LPLAT)-like uncharacterized protein